MELNDEIDQRGGDEGQRTAIWAIKGLDGGGGPTIHRPQVHSTTQLGPRRRFYSAEKKRGRKGERGDINSILESINNVPRENRKWMETIEEQRRKGGKRDRQRIGAQMPPWPSPRLAPQPPSFVSWQAHPNSFQFFFK